VLIFSGGSLDVSYMGAFYTHDIFIFIFGKLLIIYFILGFSVLVLPSPIFALFVSCYSFFIYLYNFPFKKKKIVSVLVIAQEKVIL
jgi:hypothetical protein